MRRITLVACSQGMSNQEPGHAVSTSWSNPASLRNYIRNEMRTNELFERRFCLEVECQGRRHALAEICVSRLSARWRLDGCDDASFLGLELVESKLQ